MSLSYDDMEPEADYGRADWQEQQMEEAWLESLDDLLDEELHAGEDPDELDE